MQYDLGEPAFMTCWIRRASKGSGEILEGWTVESFGEAILSLALGSNLPKLKKCVARVIMRPMQRVAEI